MPDLEFLHDPDAVIYRNGKPFRAIDVITGNIEEQPRQRYSTKAKRRKLSLAIQRNRCEPSSFNEAGERGLNYYWDTGK